MPIEIVYEIKPTDIEWEMDWSDLKEDGTRRYPDQPEKEIVFEKEKAIALMLINEVVFINSHHWEKDWPEQARKSTAIIVICSDVFAWGGADGEEVIYEEVEELYRMWKADPKWGSALWCMKKRREMPQTPVEDAMRKDGIDLDSFQKENNLRINFYNGLEAARRAAGVKWGDTEYAAIRKQFIADNGWEGDAA